MSQMAPHEIREELLKLGDRRWRRMVMAAVADPESVFPKETRTLQSDTNVGHWVAGTMLASVGGTITTLAGATLPAIAFAAFAAYGLFGKIAPALGGPNEDQKIWAEAERADIEAEINRVARDIVYRDAGYDDDTSFVASLAKDAVAYDGARLKAAAFLAAERIRERRDGAGLPRPATVRPGMTPGL